MAYDSTYSKIYFVGGVNKLYGIKVNEDGTFGDLEEKVQFCDTGYSSMTPIVYDGKFMYQEIMVNLLAQMLNIKDILE